MLRPDLEEMLEIGVFDSATMEEFEESSQFSLDIPVDQLTPEDSIDEIMEMLESKKMPNITVLPKLLGYLLSTSHISNAEEIIDILLKERINVYSSRCLAVSYLFSDYALKESINYLLRDLQDDEQRSIAIFSASFIVFIASEDEESTTKLISLLQTIARKSDKRHKTSPLTLIAALTSIFVLSTTLDDDDFIRIAKDMMSDLIFYCDQHNLELSLVSAEILAYIYQRFNSLNIGFEYKSKMVQILDKQQLVVNKSVGKKEKPVIAKRLKAVIATISTGKGPSSKPLKHEDDWVSYLRMRLLRIILGSGLYLHLSVHHIFQEMFDVQEDLKLDRTALKELKLQQKDRDSQQKLDRMHKQESYFGE